MTTNHRAEAEKDIRLIKRLADAYDISDSATVASMHALLAIHDLLAARLPQTPPAEPEPEPLDEELDDDIRGGRLRIENGWLVEEVDEHTCGAGRDGHYGLHEPGCGMVPVTRLDDLPGWPQTPPSSAPAAPVSDDPAPEAPVDPQDATGPQGGTGRIGWLRPSPSCPYRYLAREAEGGWSIKDHDHGVPEWDAREWTDTEHPGAVFTPLLPGFFVAPDDHGTLTIWRETGGDPVAALNVFGTLPGNAAERAAYRELLGLVAALVGGERA